MKDNRPVNLQLAGMKFPITAIASILHRVSGVVLFLAIPFLLWVLDSSLHSSQGFDCIARCMQAPWLKLIVLALMAGLIYHMIAGIRHILMDMGFGEGKCSGKIGAWLVILISIILVIATGVFLW